MSAFLDAPMNLLFACFTNTSVSMIDFRGKKERGGGNKNGQQKKGAGIKRQRGRNVCKKYQLYEGCELLNTSDDLNSEQKQVKPKQKTC